MSSQFLDRPIVESGRPAKRKRALDRIFAAGVIVKGIDGAAELVAGLLLWLGPHLVHTLLLALGEKAGKGHGVANDALAGLIAHLDGRLSSGDTLFLTVFLVIHGVIKIALVYCLLRQLHRVYPWAIGVLAAFLAYQLHVLVVTPTAPMIAFTLLDVIIIALAWREYRFIRREIRAAADKLPLRTFTE